MLLKYLISFTISISKIKWFVFASTSLPIISFGPLYEILFPSLRQTLLSLLILITLKASVICISPHRTHYPWPIYGIMLILSQVLNLEYQVFMEFRSWFSNCPDIIWNNPCKRFSLMRLFVQNIALQATQKMCSFSFLYSLLFQSRSKHLCLLLVWT